MVYCCPRLRVYFDARIVASDTYEEMFKKNLFIPGSSKVEAGESNRFHVK